MKQRNYKDVNIENINIWMKALNKNFVFEIPENIHLLEKTKIVKKNILSTLEVAHKVVSLSNDKNIFETSQNQEEIATEIENIRKDVVSIAIFGQMKSGKSSFINALIGEELMIVKQSRATATISTIRHIDNFDNKKDGDIEIYYKSEEEMTLRINETIKKLDDCVNFDELILSNSLTDFIEKKEQYIERLESIDFSEIDTLSNRKEAKGLVKFLKLIIDGIDEIRENLGKCIISDKIDERIQIDAGKSIFINNIVFYKDIPLLKNIELVDTPGLGSNSQLDTKTSAEFIEKADIVMILTDAVKPMQQDGENDIFYYLQEIQDSKKSNNFFDKVFIVVNKIDANEELDRDGIKELLLESLEDVEVNINDKNIMYISSMYEYQKKFSPEGIKDLNLENPDNITENDLETIENTIYNFSAAESTNKFLQENISKIENMFEKADKTFENNIAKIDGDIKKSEDKIKQFQSEKKILKSKLDKVLGKIVKEAYQDIKDLSLVKVYETMDKTSKYKYAFEKAKKAKTFKGVSFTDNTGNKDYKRRGEDFITELEDENNRMVEDNLNSTVLTEKKKVSIQEKLEEKSTEIQKEYDNKYGVSLNLNSVKINSIKFNLTDNINLEMTTFQFIKYYLNPLTFGSENKYIDFYSTKWAEYAKNDLREYIKEEITTKIKRIEEENQRKVNNEINNIVETIEKQLKSELQQQKNFTSDKEKTNHDKNIVKDTFNLLNSYFISKAKAQNESFFQ